MVPHTSHQSPKRVFPNHGGPHVRYYYCWQFPGFILFLKKLDFGDIPEELTADKIFTYSDSAVNKKHMQNFKRLVVTLLILAAKCIHLDSFSIAYRKIIKSFEKENIVLLHCTAN